MERLTLTQEQRKIEGVTYAKYVHPDILQEWDKRLSAYEDSGLSPEECAERTAYKQMYEEIRVALDESMKLHAHYVDLLNMYDGGYRKAFASGNEWIDRLRELGKL